MSASSIQHEAGRGQKLMKTKVHVLGRFLLNPSEEFNAVVARQMIDKAKRRHVSVSTELRVFDAGVQLGDHGVFASMPLEFIKYHRLVDMIVLTNDPTSLVVCVKDYEQRCVTVMRFKDAVAVKVVTDVVQKHRSKYLEELAKSSEFGSTMASKSGAGRQSNGARGVESRDHADGSNRQRVTAAAAGVRTEIREASMLLMQDTDITYDNSDPDYAVIRRRQIGSSKPQLPPPPVLHQSSDGGRSSSGGGSFFTRITVPAGPSYYQHQQQEDEKDNNWQLLEQQRQQRTMHEQYQMRRSQLLAQIGSADPDDELEMAAVFETRDGPPTLLNEPVQYVSRVTDGAYNPELATGTPDDGQPTQTTWRLADQGHYYKGTSSATGRSLFKASHQNQQAVAQ